VKALKVFAAGDDLGAYLLPAHILRGFQRTSPSTAWLLPSKYFWDENDILASVPGKGNYTVNNYKEFFQEMGYMNGYEMYKDTVSLLGDYPHPGVDVYCLYGSGVSTIERMSYKDATYFPDRPGLIMGNGDGTVNIRSLRGCLRWADEDPKDLKKKKGFYPERLKKIAWKARNRSKTAKVFHEEFPGVEHLAMLTNPDVIAYIKQIVGGLNDELLIS
jgi:lysophospholipase-3